MTDFDLGKAALENQKRLLNAVSPYLETPLRSPERAALDVAVAALRIIAKPAGEDETPLEKLTREAARTALARIKILAPDAVP